MIAEVGDVACSSATFGALYNKGLLTHIRSESGQLEYRLTDAGTFALKMTYLAGLSQGSPDPVAAENTALRRQLDEARIAGQQMAADVWDMRARLAKAERAINEARAFAEHRPPPRPPVVTLKDRNPKRTLTQILEHLDDAQAMISEAAE